LNRKDDAVGLFEKPVFRWVGDRGLLVEYGDAIDEATNRKVRAVGLALKRRDVPGLVEIVPTYRSLLLLYDPLLTGPSRLQEELAALEAVLGEVEVPSPRTVEIPVCYGGEFGFDMDFVAQHCGLSVEEVVRLHSEPRYLIYMMGFTPGFPFLGGLPRALAVPRLETPRTHVPAGSVALAANQTGIYPVASPGGWRVIGRTPLRLFDPMREEPFLYRAGDRIRFLPVSMEEFSRLENRGRAG
jgi:KipI family sensor histidine kinase inhibitor